MENERQRVIVGLIIMMMMMHVGIYELEEEEENGARYLDLVSSQFWRVKFLENWGGLSTNSRQSMKDQWRDGIGKGKRDMQML